MKSGLLTKKAQRTKRWIKHWFILKNDALSWYQSSSVGTRGRLLTSKLKHFITPKFDWWRPLNFNLFRCSLWSYCEYHAIEYLLETRHLNGLTLAQVFQSLRFIKAGFEEPLALKNAKMASGDAPVTYEVFFNVYKPTTTFRKTAPPAEDFSLVVIEFVLYHSLCPRY